MIGYRTLNVALELWGMAFCITTASIMIFGRKKMTIENQLLLLLLVVNALTLGSDSVAWVFRGNASSTGYIMVVISNFLAFFFNYTILWLFSEYVPRIIGEQNRLLSIWMTTIRIVILISVLGLIISQFTHTYYYIDAQHFYHRGSGFFISQISGIVGLIGNGIVLFQYREKLENSQLRAMFSYLILPIIATVFQLFIYGFSLLNLAITISVIWMYLVMQIRDIQIQNAQAEKILEQEKEMHELNIKVMLSQIQPHFLYNTLNSIYYLCEKDPEMAQRAVSHFSDYLRMNLDSIKNDNPIPFEIELKHVKNYLLLEKMRFDDELNIVYDIQTSDFNLPALSLQPIVENAVKYGVGKKMGGGTVLIKSYELTDSYVIKVIDDGVGFDINEIKQDGRTHIGIDNVRQRIWNMSRGRLEIETKRNRGTSASIVIPKQLENEPMDS